MPSIGAIWRSITTTSGRPSDSDGREQLERLGAASRLAHDLDVGFAVEEGAQPPAYDLVIVDDQDADALVDIGLVHLRLRSSPQGREPG